ncbi:unnamed protein product [Calypogeia fissa]
MFLEDCPASVDRQAQPWLMFLARRIPGYSSGGEYQANGTFAEPKGRDELEELCQKYKVDVATYGYVHNFERTCPVYNGSATNSGQLDAIIHCSWNCRQNSRSIWPSERVLQSGQALELGMGLAQIRITRL